MSLSLLCWGLGIGLAIPVLNFTAEVVAGCLRLGGARPVRPRPDQDQAGAGSGLVVLMPAHDEAAGLAAVIAQLRPLLPMEAELLVVADNCSDATARIATSAGASVVERIDPERRGKGYALDAGRAALSARSHPPEVVIVLDADCTVEGSALVHLATAARQGNVAQARYLMRPRPAAPAAVQFSGFAFWLKNDVRLRGAQALGTPAVLTGSGMAFPWSVFCNAPLATANIVEDLALGIALAKAGNPPLFLAEATIWSDPADMGATGTQRLRWERGFLATARAEAWPLMRAGFSQRQRSLIGLGLHLATPPFILLLGLVLAGGLCAGLAALAGAGRLPALLLFAWAVLLLAGVGLAWYVGGRPWLSPRTLLALPLYLLLKFRVYARMLSGQGKAWIRTDRKPDHPEDR